ncbi:PREDICTED: uncharacterized protein LOC108517047 isoform X1 [Rhinopithecus bieti]|uniref:uncharacterized protein LOC108517047 isoform X1 n=2 Tax=Rhinopithecus bieti TaxID=61621 RepID=UPI00083BCB22|nr:PREDICTED: uncharacterized protein LOC108517047 isoform X1 [Rhinopithecus bieti]XP_017710335.1 PREDICTED: uncharacterized protein LOC108517047 isoform X1 [Rhinopithecus bieti]
MQLIPVPWTWWNRSLGPFLTIYWRRGVTLTVSGQKSQMSQKNCEDESGAPTSPSLLQEDDSGPLSSQQQATSSRDKKPLSSLHLSHRAQVALEYLPFFCTYGYLLAEEGLVLQPETPLQEDSELLSGFFPYYRSEEESLPSTALPGWSHRGSQDAPTEKEAQAGCFCRTTVRNECSSALGWVSDIAECFLGCRADMDLPSSGTATVALQAQAGPGSRQGSPMTVIRMPLSPGTMVFMPQDSCITTEPLKRGYTLARGLLPLHLGARDPQGLPRAGAVIPRGCWSWLQQKPLESRPPAPTEHQGTKPVPSSDRGSRSHLNN